MSRAKWNANGENLPIVDAHTQAKHKILEEYVENLIITLYGKGRYGVTTFTFVDAFCGGGMYRVPGTGELWEGSPSRIIKAVERGYEKSQRHYPLDVQYIFMDSEKEHIECLRKYALPESGLEKIAASSQCVFEHGEFEERADWLILKVDLRKGHSLFFLDPFGWTQVSMQSIRKINLLSGSEIVYTYMIDFMARFIEQRHETQRGNFRDVLEAEDYYLEAKSDQIDTIHGQCYLRNESMRLFREKGKAKRVFTFALISRGERRVLYYLIHMSGNQTALEVIKDSFWKENTLDYQYYFELYGHGFRSVDFYQQDQITLRFDISRGSDSFCIDKLDGDVGKMIRTNVDGVTFKQVTSRLGLK
jgi:three-Cys-motif partner protein